ncbi:retinol dehydrogenase 13 [Elysia marginata]|uniref:Retinol dehydrogenase 13 n=1 Tax=Elysia marginata TaxID=1093978 RepID=A0AAV4FM70_9GAST|nr:retinol dehydrogenase 13 [Elysia marginata]
MHSSSSSSSSGYDDDDESALRHYPLNIKMMFWGPGQLLGILLVLIVIIVAALIFFRQSIVRCNSKADLKGKTAIVTGANSGIGFYTALDFAKRNARVILACRDQVKAERAKQEIVSLSDNKNVIVEVLDLCYMKSVREFANKIMSEESRLDILVNNAGVVSTGKPKELTDEGLETIFAGNYFGPFLLTNLLLDLMKTSAPSRIINVSSVVNKFGTIDFDNLNAEKSFKFKDRYFDSKLAQILFTRELALRLEGTGVTVNALHPGSVATNLLRNVFFLIRIPVELFVKFFCRTAEEGAQTSIYLAVSEEVTDISGKYFVDCDIKENEANPLSRNKDVAKQLWEVSEQLTGLKGL